MHIRIRWRPPRESMLKRFNFVVVWGSVTGVTTARITKDLVKLNRDQLRWVVGLFTGHCHLKGRLLTLLGRWPYLRKVPRKRLISHTYPMRLWGHSLFKISSPGPVFYGTKLLLRRPHKYNPTFHSKCRTDKGLTKRGSTTDLEGRCARAGLLWFTPYAFIHSFICGSNVQYIWSSLLYNVYRWSCASLNDLRINHHPLSFDVIRINVLFHNLLSCWKRSGNVRNLTVIWCGLEIICSCI
jgi:hypothetical protein